jgi:hypothetical protein
MRIHIVAQLLAAFVILSVFISPAHAAVISTWSVGVELLEDGSADWTIDVVYKENINTADYWVLGNVQNLMTTVDGVPAQCSVAKAEIGSSITCSDINGSDVRYEFATPNVVSKIGEFLTFSRNFPIAGLIDHFTLRVSLPRGAVLASAERLQSTGLTPFSPSYGKEGTDGQHIFVTWELHNPKLGENLNAEVLYEYIFITPAFPYILGAFAIIVALGLSVLYLYRFRRKPEHLLLALEPGERGVMEVVIKHKSVNQRDVVRATGFSKAKVSRIIQSLADRRLIEAIPKGRTREIRLLEPKTVESGLKSQLLKFRIRKRAGEMMLDRAQAVEIIQTTLTPLIDWLDFVIERLHKRKFGYTWNGSEYSLAEQWTRPTISELWMKDLKNLMPDIDVKLNVFDKQLEKVNTSLDKFSSAINENKVYKKNVSQLARRYNLSQSDIQSLARHLIDADKTVSDSYNYAHFWNENVTALRRAAESAPVAKNRIELERAATTLSRLSREVKGDIENIREQLRKRYHILYREYRK